MESGLPLRAQHLAFVLAHVLPWKDKPNWHMKAGEGNRLVSTLAKQAKMSPATLHRACNDLEEAGFLRRESRTTKRGRLSSTFRLHVPTNSHIESWGDSQTESLEVSQIERDIVVPLTGTTLGASETDDDVFAYFPHELPDDDGEARHDGTAENATAPPDRAPGKGVGERVTQWEA